MLAAAVPAWFATAIAAEPTHHDVEVDGVEIHYRGWGTPGAPGVVLLHGGAAHSGWWDHVGPLLAHGRRVVAVDLSGHGDSEWKPEYDRAQWAREVAAVIREEDMQPAVFVGHSMGGWVSVYTGVLDPDAVRAIIAIDSPLNQAPPEEQPLSARPPNRVYDDLADAMRRFRTVPPQPVLLPYVAEHVARQSLRQVEDGWTWKFDTGIFGNRGWTRDLLPRLAVPACLIRCENGMVDAEMAARIASLHRDGMPVVELPDAGHHAMFDQPLPLVAALRALLTTWA